MIYDKTRYIAPYSYLINKDIQEYDIAKANISILRDSGYLNEDQYKYFYNLPKQEREIKIGLLIRRDPKVNKILSNGFLNARKIFFESNHIEDASVLYIDKDSVTFIDFPVTVHQISDHVDFKFKDTYTSFYRLNGIDFLYFNNNRKERYRFKNVNKDMLEMYHHEYMIDFLLSMAYMAQSESILNVILSIKEFYKQYTSRSLPCGYYREFNNTSRFKALSSSGYNWYIENIDYNMTIDELDISYNANIIRYLYKIFMNEYFKTI